MGAVDVQLADLFAAAFQANLSPMAIIRVRDARFMAINDGYCRMIGLPRDEVLGRSSIELGVWDDPAEHDDLMAILRRQGYVDNHVARFRTPEGEVRIGHFSVRMIEIDGEQYSLSTIHEVTDTDQLERVRRRRGAILEAAGFAAQQFLRAANWEGAVPEILARLGEATGTSRAWMFENHHLPDGRLASSVRFEWDAPGIESQLGNPALRDAPWDDSGFGRWVPILSRGVPIASLVRDLPKAERPELEEQGIQSIVNVPVMVDGEWWGTIGFDDCVTEREWDPSEIDALFVAAGTLGAAIQRKRGESRVREAEERFRSLVERIPAVVYLDGFGGDFATIYTSPQVEEMLGYSPSEWSVREFWESCVHPDDFDRVIAEDRRTNESEEPFRMEYRVLARDGRVVWIHDEAVVVRDEDGAPRFWQGVMFEISDVKRAEEELARALEMEREALRRLRALDEMKNTFLQAVSHDLRTPLAAVLGSAITLDRSDLELPPEEARDLVHRIVTNARKLSRLVTDLLDLDRLSRGILRPKRQPVDIQELVRSVAEESRPLLGDRTIHVETQPATVDLDAPKVERIVENLLANSARHTPPGSRVWVRMALEDGGVTIAVEDNGPGIPEELREDIFDAFRQGPTPSAHAPGSGIGLALVARFAELHGGRAWVEERAGGGASFRVFLADTEAADD